MALQLVVNGVPYTYPVEGTNPQWGEGASDWAEAVTNLIGTLVGEFDILNTNFVPANNVTTAEPVIGLIFSTLVTRSVEIEYTCYRISEDSGSGVSELSERGKLQLVRNSNANTWDLAQQKVGDSGIDFEITSNGQINYKTSNMPADTSYLSNLNFSAKVIVQVVE